MEGAGLFHMMGLKKNASEGSSSRAQWSTKRIRRQSGPSERTKRGGRRGFIAGINKVIDEQREITCALLEENLLEVLVQEENLWPHLEDIVEEETVTRRQRLGNKQSGCGDWPKTAANQP